MTAICPSGGPSQAKAAFNQTVAMTVPAIAALLNNVPVVWAVPFAALIGLVAYDLSTFCTTDAPALPTLVASDFTELLDFGNFAAHAAAVAKLSQYVAYYAWFQFCECTTQPTPAYTPGQSQPTGMPAINPPGGSGPYPTGTPCLSFSGGGPDMVSGAMPNNFMPIQGATSVVITVSTALATIAPGTTFRVYAEFDNASFTILGTAIWIIQSTGITNNTPFVVPAGTTQMRVQTQTTGGSTLGARWNAQWDFYCGTTPGGGGGSVPTPCVTDPITTLQLQAIMDMLTLIQRQAVPFATIHGTVHAGLSGDGQFAVQGILGLAVHITTAPARLGLVVGDPNTIYDAGWVNTGTADGWGPRQFLSSDPFILKPVSGDTTLVGYSIPADVVVTITELVREA